MRLVNKMMYCTGMWLALMVTVAHAVSLNITPPIQAELDKWATVLTEWAADPIIVHAVLEQNSKGPIPELDNAKWKTIPRSDPLVKAFQTNPAGQFLTSKLEDSEWTVGEAFLSAVRGEKVAFVEKTTSYIHRGQAKFDVPLTTGKPWQGQAEFDESSNTYAIQISVPVFADGKPCGVLVAGITLGHLLLDLPKK